MTNNLIKNETEVYYTVDVNKEVIVRKAEFYSGRVDKVEVSRERKHAYEYRNKEVAQQVAQYVDGKVIKHTRTEVITEVIEEEK